MVRGVPMAPSPSLVFGVVVDSRSVIVSVTELAFGIGMTVLVLDQGDLPRQLRPREVPEIANDFVIVGGGRRLWRYRFRSDVPRPRSGRSLPRGPARFRPVFVAGIVHGGQYDNRSPARVLAMTLGACHHSSRNIAAGQ